MELQFNRRLIDWSKEIAYQLSKETDPVGFTNYFIFFLWFNSLMHVLVSYKDGFVIDV
ncbi:hypothetical protein C1645_787511 [Glomus cerebriforme]|uniref:Uncharacterized protein n=1 Tax=Glomus cerebriforme TaxID=658196 RepID=A0A397SA78_9GLOM|nr:hypothetical protein C1645_787511 [Glomus cerebriforme]